MFSHSIDRSKRSTPDALGTDETLISNKLPWLVKLFLLSMLIPIEFSVSAVALSPTRLVMIVFIIPVFISFIRGSAGKILTCDKFFILYCIWLTVSMWTHYGIGRIEFTTISVVEFLFPYMLARIFIRNAGQYRRLVIFLYRFVLLLGFTAIFETFFGVRIFDLVFGLLGLGREWSSDTRFGLHRATTVFEHPILFGIFASTLLSPTIYTINGSKVNKIGNLLVVMITFLSLSSAAILSVALQVILVGWEKFVKSKTRWYVFSTFVFFLYIFIEMLSNRSAFAVIISYLTFDPSTGYWRMLIFDFGIENVYSNPVFGLGLEDWIRPVWMQSASVDNYWLLNAMRYGAPGFFLLLLGFLSVVFSVARNDTIPSSSHSDRLGYVFSLSSLIVSLCTVHMWGSAAYALVFLMGSGVWMSSVKEDNVRPTSK